MTVIDSIVKQAGDSRKSMDWYRTKVRNATGTGTTARQLIRQGKASSEHSNPNNSNRSHDLGKRSNARRGSREQQKGFGFDQKGVQKTG